MHTNLFMYLTAMSAVSIHNLMSNLMGPDLMTLRTMDTNWTYDDPNLLSKFPSCNGTRQSPINIDSTKVKENVQLRLSLTAYDKPVSCFLINQFPTFQLLPFSFKLPRPSVVVSSSRVRSFNPLSENHYLLSSVKFFWSWDEKRNSSLHHMNNELFPAELHFIHYNSMYSSLDEASTRANGILILAVLVVSSSRESYIFDRILNEQSNITKHGDKIFLEEDSTWRSLLPDDTSSFYRYHGSMIEPPCQESVQWIIFKENLKLGARQLARLRKINYVGKDVSTGREVIWSAQRRPIQQQSTQPTVEQSFRSIQPDKRREQRRES